MRPAALAAATLAVSISLLAFGPLVSPATANIDLTEFDSVASVEGGGPAIQAGSHPSELVSKVTFPTAASEGGLRDLHIALPPGLIENPIVVNRCSEAQFSAPRVSPFEASQSGESCPEKAQVGVITVNSGLATGPRNFGLYNLAPTPGSPYRLAASPFGIPLTLTSHIRQAEGEYAPVLDLLEVPPSLELEGFTLHLWGTPWNLTHNTERGNCLNEKDPEEPWAKCSVGRPASNPAQAFLTLPSSCTGPLETVATADSWHDSGAYLPDGEPDPADPAWTNAVSFSGEKLVNCNLLAFSPAAVGQLSTDRAASPTGFDLAFDVDEEGLLNPKLIAPSQPRTAVVSLAEGMTVNPSVGAGLGVCSPAQYAAETATSTPGTGCPNEAKIGDLTVTTPLFEKPIEGSLYLAQPHANPFGSLLAVYLIAKSRARGVLVKVAGRLDADPSSGRLTATFENLPQLPYSHFRVDFREGQRSPLLSPSSCGSYQTQADFTPWLEAGPTVEQASGFTITHGIEGSPCPNGTTPPFTPGAVAGALNAQAGAYSPFYLHLTRTDPEQEITSYSAQLPPGLLGKIAGVPFCPDAAIEAAKGMGGVAETEHPSCPAASQIGHTYTGFGVGSVLAYAPGGLYLAGPYHGAPLSIVAIDAATVGPFDLGTIVIRSAIRVDPHSARVSIDSAGSDPIPHILDGIPLHLRDIRVYVNRPNFTVNPTTCDPLAVTSTLTGSAPPFTNPDVASASPSVLFQVSDCAGLGFAPKLALALTGGTRRGSYPSLHATVTARAGDANIATAAVTLPPSEFLAQNHIKAICTAPQLTAEACPPGSVYGRASALTPLLEEPLTGPVYLRSSTNLLPDLVAVLSGRGVRIVVEGRIDSNKGALRGTFEGLPDAPLTKFTMILKGGKRGLLVNEKNLCAAPQRGTARFLGQDNSGVVLKPRLSVKCRKQGKKRHRKTRTRGAGE